MYRGRFTQNGPSIGAGLPGLAPDWAGLFMVIELEAGVAVDHGEGNAVRSGTAETPPGVSTGDSAEGVTVAVRREGVTADAATYSGRRYVLGWNCARNVPSVSLAADAEPRHVIAATLAATFAATCAATSRRRAVIVNEKCQSCMGKQCAWIWERPNTYRSEGTPRHPPGLRQ